jgi:hypothetical protein
VVAGYSTQSALPSVLSYPGFHVLEPLSRMGRIALLRLPLRSKSLFGGGDKLEVKLGKLSAWQAPLTVNRLHLNDLREG